MNERPSVNELLSGSELGPALGLGPGPGSHELVAVVGGGGKTTIAHHLAHHLSGRCVLTTTTKMGYDQHGGRPVLVSPTDAQVAAIDGLTVVWRAIDEPVALGVDPGQCDRWFGLVDHLVVEADGARRRPFKAPAPYEPVVPSASTLVVSVIGADALGAPIDTVCHRAPRVAALAGCEPDQTLTPERAARVLTHPDGYRASVPAGARLVLVVTKVSPERQSLAHRLARAVASQPEAGNEGAETGPLPLYTMADGAGYPRPMV